ncbi:Probable erythromycin esterase [Flavobacterium indicum GPTSA100-9 = DSM 17447]|uniref:Probable erythromycin esterase n=1 Tax=Flavobacterium indicum (strain DSM 17447 / CIP 109464 / GPTSA100-9) TaxID=1094466 RepID=H8XP95_FLAIG|nr:erythromycin esterase family protein [Flavobacterium indicum]CCG53169.1 Probable erythromycin esterase [Flavobacterium indicum GPTSA100-9 = DSM 17447]
MTELKSENGIPTDFKKLDQYIANKEIILLGEAAHGEGKTFEVKTQIVKYLVEEKGFNTIAMEGMDFLQMEFINGRNVLKNNLPDNFENEWYNFWNPWNPAKQLISFESFIKNSKISFAGIEPYENITAMINISFIKNELEKSNWAILNKKEWLKLAPIFEKINTNKSKLSIEEFDYITLQLENFIKENELIHFQDNFFTQMVENLITHVKMNFNPNTFSNEDEETAYYVNTRDHQMARNLIYFKERNPKAKIIVWLANFHGATNLSEVTYADGDPNMYSKLKVFGEHVKKKYSEKVYSIATTSSKGFSKIPYNLKGIEETKIISPKESLEFDLDKQKYNFGFIDFNEININNPKKIEEKFNSIMLGHTNQNGKWLKVFDGLLYIKENEIAIPRK